MLFPPGVPMAVYILVTPIELVTTLHRAAALPGGPALRQHAGRPPAAGQLRGHHPGAVRVDRSSAAALPFALLIVLTGFELLVAFLQAYIFTILAAVYIGGAMHPEH